MVNEAFPRFVKYGFKTLHAFALKRTLRQRCNRENFR